MNHDHLVRGFFGHKPHDPTIRTPNSWLNLGSRTVQKALTFGASLRGECGWLDVVHLPAIETLLALAVYGVS